MRRHLLRVCGTLLGARVSVSGEPRPRTWTQGDYADFEKGVLKNLSLRSDGRLTLAPHSQRTLRFGDRLPVGAGAGFERQSLCRRRARGKAVPHPSGWQGQKLADLDALEIHAHRGRFQGPRLCRHAPDGKVYRIDRDGKKHGLLRSRSRSTSGRCRSTRGQSFRRDRRSGRDPPRDAGRQRQGLLQER